MRACEACGGRSDLLRSERASGCASRRRSGGAKNFKTPRRRQIPTTRRPQIEFRGRMVCLRRVQVLPSFAPTSCTHPRAMFATRASVVVERPRLAARPRAVRRARGRGAATTAALPRERGGGLRHRRRPRGSGVRRQSPGRHHRQGAGARVRGVQGGARGEPRLRRTEGTSSSSRTTRRRSDNARAPPRSTSSARGSDIGVCVSQRARRGSKTRAYDAPRRGCAPRFAFTVR